MCREDTNSHIEIIINVLITRICNFNGAYFRGQGVLSCVCTNRTDRDFQHCARMNYVCCQQTDQ